MLRKENGITLVALVITIVVLLILAGVAITSLTGQNSIINKAREAQNAYVADTTNTDIMLNTAVNIIEDALKTDKTTDKTTDTTTNTTTVTNAE